MSDDTGGAPPDDAPAPAPAPAPPAPPEDEQSAPAYRVKVYRLNEDGQWDDCGTGSVTLAKGSAPTILVLSENNDRGARGALLASRLIPSQDAYTKQGENIITWDTRRGDGGSAIADKAANETACVALSFQEKHGCDDLYARLQAAAARLIAALSRSRSLSPPPGDRGALRGARDDEPGPPGVDDDGDAARAVAVLLRRQAEAEAGQFGGGSGGGAPRTRAFLAHLAASFDDAEDGDDVEVLVKLADVVKLVVLLNEPPLVEALLDDPLFEPVLGALEYAADLKKQHAALARPAPARAPPAGAADADAEVAAATAAAPDDDDEAANRRASVESGNSAAATEGAVAARARFRVGSPLPGALLGDERPRTAAEARRVPLRRLALRASQMREVVPMEDATLRMRVVQNFRAAVLKEAALRPGMDDAQLSSIHGLVFSNNNEILRRLYDHTDYLKRVVALVGSGAPEAAAESLEADLLEDGDGGAEAAHRRDRGLALRFLREMVGLSRNAQPQSRDALYRHLFFETELYGALATALADCGHRSRPSGAGGDGYAHTAAAAVERCVRGNRRDGRRGNGGNDDANKKARKGPRRGRRRAARLLRGRRPAAGAGGAARRGPALFWVLRLLACDGDLATLMHASDAARLVLDSETMDEPERDAFLALFYDKYLPWLVEPLYDVRVVGGDGVEVPLEDAAPGPGLRVANGAACAHVCELLAYCVRAHAYRMKYFVLRNHVAARVVALVECGGAYGDKPLVLAALRFVRACVGAKDDFYTRYLVKNGSLGPVFRLLGNAAAASPAPPPPEDSGATSDTVERARNRPPRVVPGDSLVTSAVAELAEFVRVENVKGLVAHIVEVHGATLKKSVLHRSLLEGLETRHAQNKDLLERAARGFGGAKDDAPLTAAQLERRARIATEDADEAYFDDDDDFDDDMDDASDDDEAPGAPPGPPPGFAPREAARRRPPGRSPTPPRRTTRRTAASGDSASSRHRAKRGLDGARRAQPRSPSTAATDGDDESTASSKRQRRERVGGDATSSPVRSPPASSSPPPSAFSGGAFDAPKRPFARRAPTALVVKIEWSAEKAADLDGFARAGNDDEPPADEPNGAAKKAKLGESDASQS
ncbi:hypothetical protein JL721_1084 [Aureococcus anophagefferens]|nr:hypothetical protein JL721_1084 [Aureococcus anophagefferens]